MNQHPDARVTVTGGGTGSAFQLMDNIDGYCHGFPSDQIQRKDETKEAGQEVDEVIVAYDAPCRSGATLPIR